MKGRHTTALFLGVADFLSLLIVFNVLFLAPVIAIAVMRGLAGVRGVDVLGRIRSVMLRHAGPAVASLVGAVGVALIVLGAVGIVA